LFWLLVVAAGCSSSLDDSKYRNGSTDFTATRPSVGEPTASVVPYSGTNQVYIDAQTRLPTGIDLQQKAFSRTCGPTGGVCHNTKEYPDLHTPANFLAAVGAPCNIQSGTPDGIYDRCERQGDQFVLGDRAADTIGYITYIAGNYDPDHDGSVTDTTPGLHLQLKNPISGLNRSWDRGNFVRSLVDEDQVVKQLNFFSFDTEWWSVGDGAQVFARVQDYQGDAIQGLLQVGLIEGDANHDGTFGADVYPSKHPYGGMSLIEPGSPNDSYILGRLLGELTPSDTNVAEPVPGTRMPLANQPFDEAEMLAFKCFISGLFNVTNPTLESPIDYTNCEVVTGTTGNAWTSRFRGYFNYRCGTCHSGNTPKGDLDLVDGDVYPRILGPSSQRPELNLIEPGDPSKSYIWLKLTNDPSIVEKGMPLDVNKETLPLPQADLDAIKAWIVAGALEQDP
jgi:hypothetical protein